MAERKRVIVVDWRKIGDYSAVGQLIDKIFLIDQSLEVYQLLCAQSRHKCTIMKRTDTGSMNRVFDWEVSHSAAINKSKAIKPHAIYVRLSPHIETLELACKMAVTFNTTQLIVHYMDTPHLDNMRPARANYIRTIYRFLIAAADRFYAIHETSAEVLKAEHVRDVFIMRNFIASDLKNRITKFDSGDARMRLSYFGSIDKKMNLKAINEICASVKDIDWLELRIWSNSGIDQQTKNIIESSNNIAYSDSNLENQEYVHELAKSDLLLLPYNNDDDSVRFLQHSFSNKFMDYLEADRTILCYGSTEVPTIAECFENQIGIVCETLSDFQNLLSSKESLQAKIDATRSTEVKEKTKKTIASQRRNAHQFIEYLNRIEGGVVDCVSDYQRHPSHFYDEIAQKRLSFLIRRKFYDHMKSGESVASNWIANLKRRHGYNGVDYEV